MSKRKLTFKYAHLGMSNRLESVLMNKQVRGRTEFSFRKSKHTKGCCHYDPFSDTPSVVCTYIYEASLVIVCCDKLDGMFFPTLCQVISGINKTRLKNSIDLKRG